MTIDHLSPPADRLRAAAELLREQATAATPGPWVAGGGAFRPWELCIATDLPLVELDNSRQGRADAAYIGTVHPGVGLALADLLDRSSLMAVAAEVAGYTPSSITLALAVADALLGIPAAKALADQQAQHGTQAVTG